MDQEIQPQGAVDDGGSIRFEIWDRAFYATATASTFEYRAELLKRRLRLLNFVALVVPVIVGSLALGYGAGFRYLSVAVAIGAAIGIGQLVISLWAVVAAWVENYGYAITSLIDNQKIARDLEALVQKPTSDSKELQRRFDLIKVADDARQAQDYAQGLTDEEKRRGHRAALRKRGMKCSGCGEIPMSMAPSECGVCGQYKTKKF
ncbi:mobilome CxxCx(11)CxxC protein [Actinoplanes sp. NPDC049118]|uniref:mobilome CxxCx(11)CxxC protein n=1 Tax=Actinoplanes sp. NPDC049118 TaxID=3155769 RepID=UPI0034074F2E